MERLRILLTVMIAILMSAIFSGSCSHDNEYSPRLQHIDSLLFSSPDSAYSLLKQVDTSEFLQESDRAYHNLLWAEARYKTFHDDTTDIAITSAAEYFTSVADRNLAMRARYMQGRILRNKGERTEALVALLDAVENADTSDHLYLGKIYYEMSGVYNEIGDGPMQESYARQSLEQYKKLDSLVFILDTQLWYASTLSHVGKYAQALKKAREIYNAAVLVRDTFAIREALDNMATSELWQDHYENAKDCYTILCNYYVIEDMPYKMLDQYLTSLINTNTSGDSIRWLASIIDRNWGHEKVSHLYYSSIGDYKSAWEAVSVEYSAIDNEYVNQMHSATHAAIQSMQERKAEEAQNRLSLLRMRNIWIYSIIGMAVLAGVMWWIYSHKLKQRKIVSLQSSLLALQRDWDNMSEKYRKSGESLPFSIEDLFSRINSTYSEYYGANQEERQKDYLLKEFRKEVDVLRSNQSFVEKIENHIDCSTGGLLNDVYSCMRSLEMEQRRLVVFLYYGFSTSTICNIYDCTPQVVYNRKSRVVAHLRRSTSPRLEELLSIIGSKFGKPE